MVRCSAPSIGAEAIYNMGKDPFNNDKTLLNKETGAESGFLMEIHFENTLSM